jgi:hypothetical protein
MSREDHPVWSVYDKLRSACLNVKYYSRRLQSLERWNFGLEFLIGATAPSSAIAALWFWNTEYGQPAWRYLAVIAAIAAVAKPLLNLTKRIKEYESILSGYRTLEYDLREISTLIEQKKKYDHALQTEFKKGHPTREGPYRKKIQKPENAHGSSANAHRRYGYSFHPPAFLYLTRKQTMTDGTEPKPKPQPPSHPHPTPRREPIQPSHFPPSPEPSREHPRPEYLPEHVEPDEPWPRR